MKPTPLGKTYLEYETELKEYNLAKTELAMQKVELGLVDDFEKKTGTFFIQGGKFETAVQKIELGIKEMQKQFIELQKISSSIDNDYQKVRKASLELGVSIPTKIENNYKKTLAILKNILQLLKNIINKKTNKTQTKF
jgi:hypothetical protein